MRDIPTTIDGTSRAPTRGAAGPGAARAAARAGRATVSDVAKKI
jgi:hypothetical protein